MYFIGHQRSRGWKFCNLLAVLLFSVRDVKIMCQYLLIGYITELGITKGPSAATRTPLYRVAEKSQYTQKIRTSDCNPAVSLFVVEPY